MPDARVDSLSDQVPLQLRDGRHNREKCLAQRTGRVDVLLVGDELHTELAEFFEREQQMLCASSEAVEAPDHD